MKSSPWASAIVLPLAALSLACFACGGSTFTTGTDAGSSSGGGSGGSSGGSGGGSGAAADEEPAAAVGAAEAAAVGAAAAAAEAGEAAAAEAEEAAAAAGATASTVGPRPCARRTFRSRRLRVRNRASSANTVRTPSRVATPSRSAADRGRPRGLPIRSAPWLTATGAPRPSRASLRVLRVPTAASFAITPGAGARARCPSAGRSCSPMRARRVTGRVRILPPRGVL